MSKWKFPAPRPEFLWANPDTQKDTLKWKKVSGEFTGLVDIARTYPKQQEGPECVLARTTIQSDKDQVKKLIFGYSDEVSIFLRG